MLKNIIALAGSFLMVMHAVHAQTETPPVKKFDQYAGVQANLLFRQILNLSNSNTAVNNPYLLTYAIHCTKSGYGLQAGFGYNYQLIDDKIPISRESKINELFYRIGAGRKIMIGKKWQLGYGLDYVGDYQSDKTATSSITNNGSTTDSSSAVSTSKTTTSGFGAQASLGFYITRRIIISTEATYYYSTSKVKQNVFVVDNVTQNFVTPPETTATVTNSNQETDKTTFSFALPVALFLVLKF